MRKISIFLLISAMILVAMSPVSTVFAADSVKVQFFNGNTAATINTLYTNFKLVNTGTTVLTLSSIKMRYYFTNDGTQANSFTCDWSAIGSGNVTGTFGTVTAPTADRYLEVGFGSGAGALAVGASVEVKARMWKSDWSDFTQTNDYSFNASAASYTDSAVVTAYINSTLVWGAEAGGTQNTPTPTPTPVIGTPTPTATPAPTPSGIPGLPWDWAGIIGTGQSLSVGGGTPILTTQPYNNLKLSLGSLTGWPMDPNSSQLSVVPLVEPIHRLATGFPGCYPANIFGETPHTAMADQITSMARAAPGIDYVSVHTVVGESGQGMSVIRKGATDTGTAGRAYAASIFEAKAIKRLAAAAGKTYGIGAIILTHGETDCGSPTYENDMRQMWSDYNQDLKAITGQAQKIPLLTSQQHSYPTGGGTSASTLAEWKAGADYPGDIVCTGPKYQYTYNSDAVHLGAAGYEQLGEKIGQVYYERVVLGHDWQPLQPVGAVRTGTRVITVNFHVPAAPLVWDTTMPAPNQSALTEWKNGKGFEVYTSGGSRITISSVEISGDSVVITCASDLPASGLKAAYAFTSGGKARPNGTIRWGLLRDSDPFKGSTTGAAQPNFCVAFEMAVP